MAIVQETYDIPTAIWAKMLAREYKRISGVVRHTIGMYKSEIVNHIKPVDLLTAKQSKRLSINTLQSVKTNKNSFIFLGASTGITLTGSGNYYKLKTHELKIIIEFRLSLRIYLDAI